MSPAALYFASGDALYPGVAMLFLAIVSPSSQSRGLRIFRSLTCWAGLALVVMASTPVSGWAAAVFIGAFLLWLISKDRAEAGPAWYRLRVVVSSVLLLMLLALSSREILHRRMPRLGGNPSDHFVVIGDSISSGIDSHTPAWPMLMQRQTDILVRNLSRPGAGVVEARAMASQVQQQDNLILIEIGGNDLLSDMSSARFGEGLESVLASLSKPGRTLVMFELPLLPHKIGFGRVQRRLSAKYGICLIPKHFFTAVLSGAGATSDGLHLSESGAREMETLVARLLWPALRPAKPTAQ
jgi:lysophospholipase L1-like esterase